MSKITIYVVEINNSTNSYYIQFFSISDVIKYLVNYIEKTLKDINSGDKAFYPPGLHTLYNPNNERLKDDFCYWVIGTSYNTYIKVVKTEVDPKDISFDSSGNPRVKCANFSDVPIEFFRKVSQLAIDDFMKK